MASKMKKKKSYNQIFNEIFSALIKNNLLLHIFGIYGSGALIWLVDEGGLPTWWVFKIHLLPD